MQPWQYPPTYELRLGPTPLTLGAPVVTPQIENYLRIFNRYADLVGITETEIQVVEAKMVAEPGALSQLQHYLDLIHYTPILRQYAGRNLVGVLLWAVNDAIIAQRAAAWGYRVIVYTPGWTQDYLNLKYFRRQRIVPPEPSGGPVAA